MGLHSLLAALATAVTLATPTGDIEGTEQLPDGKGPFPAVLIIAGSGPTDRDGNSRLLPRPNDSLKMLAEALAKDGIASVRYDKRGIGASAKAGLSEADLRFEHLADDAAAWVTKMKSDPRFSRVVVVGHSEGSLIGMLAARKAGADAYSSIGGIAQPGDKILRLQLKGKIPADLMAESDRILDALVAGKTVADADPRLAALYRPSVQPYLVSWLRHSPTEIIGTLKMPVLIVQGTHDIQVGVEEARSLAQAHPGARLALIDGMNHVLKLTPAEAAAQMPSYSDPTLPVAPQLVNELSAFARAGRPTGAP